MSVFTGPQQRGAMRAYRASKRADAEARNEQTPQSRRRSTRRTTTEEPKPARAQSRRRRATRPQGGT